MIKIRHQIFKTSSRSQAIPRLLLLEDSVYWNFVSILSPTAIPGGEGLLDSVKMGRRGGGRKPQNCISSLKIDRIDSGFLHNEQGHQND